MKWDERGKALETWHALSKWPSSLLLLLELLLLCRAVPLAELIVSFAYGNPCANVSRAFDICNSRNMMKTTKVVVWLGLCKNVPLTPPPSFPGSSASCNLSQISGFSHWNMHFRQLVHFPVTPCVPIQQRLVITIATAACGACALSPKQSICLKKNHTHTHTLICNMKFYFMVFMKGNHASK